MTGEAPARHSLSRADARIRLSTPTDLDALGERWRALEEASEASFFQSWTWVGCLAAARFSRPVLLEAWDGDGRPAALALLNRAGRLRERLLLGESGDPSLDAVYVEHNGPLLASCCRHLLPACLRALLEAPLPAPRRLGRRLVLSGVDNAHLAAARAVGRVRVLRTRPAPHVDLSTLGEGDDAFLASLSANTRYQLRRSIRRYEAAGPLRVECAGSVAAAGEFLDALARLHQATWTARGKPGAFANPAFLRFHRALLARGGTELLRIAAGSQVLGYLYNFTFRGRVLSYQSGFDYTAATTHQKPGLTCHAAAIAYYRRRGAAIYDFLAGADPYKASLANASADLHWLEVRPGA